MTIFLYHIEKNMVLSNDNDIAVVIYRYLGRTDVFFIFHDIDSQTVRHYWRAAINGLPLLRLLVDRQQGALPCDWHLRIGLPEPTLVLLDQ